MKNILMITALFLMSVQAWSQENMVTISGGYSTANIEDTDVKGTGWRINGNYEFNPSGGIFANGVSFGYIHISASEDVLQQTVTNTIHSFPLYYAPKVMFGSDKFKGFIKGALGTQFAWLKREGVSTFTDTDLGFYGGGGAGIMIFLKGNIFINAEYEIAWASNSWYNDGWINTAMGGIGFKF
jgi:Outer membrane protein beta-barrel domain